MKDRRILVVLDLEGPLLSNDNAFEITRYLAALCGLRAFIGGNFYERISRIDDIWGDFGLLGEIDPEYASGHTLKIMLPFFRAMWSDKRNLYEYSRRTVRVLPGADSTLRNLTKSYDCRIVSTSYDFFVKAALDSCGIDHRLAVCTQTPEFGDIPIGMFQRRALLDFMIEVAGMPLIEYNRETGEIDPRHRHPYDRITDFIWNELYYWDVGGLLSDVHPVGQAQKLEALITISGLLGYEPRDILYVGDSQTDVACVKYLRKHGLTLLINAKRPVLESGHISAAVSDARVIGIIADLFADSGREAVLEHYAAGRTVPGGYARTITADNLPSLEAINVCARQKARGAAVAALS